MREAVFGDPGTPGSINKFHPARLVVPIVALIAGAACRNRGEDDVVCDVLIPECRMVVETGPLLRVPRLHSEIGASKSTLLTSEPWHSTKS